mgnify:CR=1 FL=1
MTKNKKTLKIIAIILPIIAIILFFILKHNIKNITLLLPSCIFLKYTGFYCPGCGNTRSVVSLLNGDLLSALKYNISPVLIIVTLMILYIELITYSFGSHKKILPRNKMFWIVFGVIIFLYFILRNLFI